MVLKYFFNLNLVPLPWSNKHKQQTSRRCRAHPPAAGKGLRSFTSPQPPSLWWKSPVREILLRVPVSSLPLWQAADPNPPAAGYAGWANGGVENQVSVSTGTGEGPGARQPSPRCPPRTAPGARHGQRRGKVSLRDDGGNSVRFPSCPSPKWAALAIIWERQKWEQKNLLPLSIVFLAGVGGIFLLLISPTYATKA